MLKKFLLVTLLLFGTLGSQAFASEDSQFHEKKVKNYTYTLAIAAIFRDEAPYLKEWIEFHRTVGVEHFYLINNLSVDNYLEVLQPYIDAGLVHLFNWPYEHHSRAEWCIIQCSAYMKMIKRVKGKVQWLALIDVDEFLFPVEKESLIDVLSEYQKFGGLAVNWQTFGTSNVYKVPEDELLIETLTLKAPENEGVNRHIKSIVRPECVKRCINAHFVMYKKNFYQVNSDQVKFEGAFSPYVQIDAIRINHYTVRDEHYLHSYKLPRLAWLGLDSRAYEESYKLYNQIKDETIFRFIPQLKELINQ